MRHALLAATVLLVVPTTSATAQSGGMPPFKVKLNVTFHESASNVFQSGLARELRKLDSVEVVGDRIADNELQVVGVMNANGVYSAAVLLVSKADIESPLFFSEKPDCYPTEAQQKENAEDYGNYVVVDNLWVFTDRDVQSLATRIAAAVDVNNIELHRQTHRRLKEMRRKRAQSKKP